MRSKSSAACLVLRIAFLALIVLAVPLDAKSRTGIDYAPDLDTALEQSAATGKPLLITMHTSTERACVRMLTSVFTEPEVRARLKQFIVLPTCMDAHEEVVEKVDGKERRVSALFGGVDCATLMANEQAVRTRFFNSPTVKVPQQVFVEIGENGEPRVYLSKIYQLSKSQLLDLMNEAVILSGERKIKSLDKLVKDLFKAVQRESGKERKEALQSVLRLEVDEVTMLLYPVIEKIRREKDRAECIRAMGYKEFASAAPLITRWLTDADEHIRNCAVVTLEEMANPAVLPDLLELRNRAKDEEIRKDILRALGPCGKGNQEAKAILLDEGESPKDIYRLAAYLSLGHFLETDPEVVEFLKNRYRREKGDADLKLGIVWAFQNVQNRTLADELEAMTAKERNGQVKNVADMVIRIARGERVEYTRELRKAIRTLFTRDKIVRNELLDWGGGRGDGRGGRGGGGRGR